MKSLVIMILLAVLAGCDSADKLVENNKHLCDGNGGVKGLSSGRSYPRMLLCNDRTVKWLD